MDKVGVTQLIKKYLNWNQVWKEFGYSEFQIFNAIASVVIKANWICCKFWIQIDLTEINFKFKQNGLKMIVQLEVVTSLMIISLRQLRNKSKRR